MEHDPTVMLVRLTALREWLRNGNAYLEHPDGQEGTDDAVDALDWIVSELKDAREPKQMTRRRRSLQAPRPPGVVGGGTTPDTLERVRRAIVRVMKPEWSEEMIGDGKDYILLARRALAAVDLPSENSK